MGASKISLAALRGEYQRLWDTMVVRPERKAEVERDAADVMRNRARYEALGESIGVPWKFIGVVHALEYECSFKRHLHNGDRLTARTVNVPAGRPLTGSPPFKWEDSARDALAMKRLGPKTDWTIPGILYQFERWNGFGYRMRHPDVLSPYLWSFSTHYTRGKYVADGSWSPTAVSKQVGAALILRALG